MKHNVDVKTDFRTLQKPKSDVKKAMSDLFSLLQVKITIEGLIDGIDLEETITSARLHDICVDLFKKTHVPV